MKGGVVLQIYRKYIKDAKAREQNKKTQSANTSPNNQQN